MMNAVRSGPLRRSYPRSGQLGCPSAEGSGRLFPSLEKYIAADLLAVLREEAPGVDAGMVGLHLAAEARRRAAAEQEAQGADT